MASTFTLNSGSYQGRYLSVTCTQEKNIATNKNTIYWTLTSTGGSVNYYTTGPTTLMIGGQQAYYIGQKTYTSKAFPAAKGSVSGSVVVDANANGSCSVAVSLSTAIYTSTVSTVSGTWNLDSIPRAAQLLSADNFHAKTGTPKITYENPAGNAAVVQTGIFDTEGQVCYSGYHTVSSTGTSYSYSLTDAERQKIIDATPSGTNKLSVRYYIKTLINNELVEGSLRYLTRKVTVNRSATVTSAPNFNDEANPTIKYTNPNGSTVDSVEACIASSDGKTIYVPYRSISKTGSSYTFNLTSAERTALIGAIPSGKSSVSVRFYVQTTIDGEIQKRSYLTKTLSITNATPTLSCSVKDAGSVSTGLTNNSSVMIKGYNVMSASMTPTLKKGATILKQTITNGSTTISGLSATFNYSSNNKFVFSITDSFGQTVSKTVTPTMVPYVKLTCNVTASNPTTDGNLTFKISGNYYNGSFGTDGDANTLTVKYRMKTNSGSYSSWTTVTPTKSGNTYSVTVNKTGLDYKSTYTIQATAIDGVSYNGILSTEKKVKSTPVFNWGKDNFDINVSKFNVNGNPYGYPIGSMYVGANNTSPASLFGGTWTLRHKGFSCYFASVENISDYFTVTNDNITISTLHFLRDGNSMHLKLAFTNNATFSDTGVELGTFNLEKLGITRFPITRAGYLWGTDGGNAAVMYTLNYLGTLTCTDLIARGSSTVPIGTTTLYFEIMTTFHYSYMLDSACNQFYWQRTG